MFTVAGNQVSPTRRNRRGDAIKINFPVARNRRRAVAEELLSSQGEILSGRDLEARGNRVTDIREDARTDVKASGKG